MAVPEAIDRSQLIGSAKHLSSVFFADIIDDSLKKEEEIRCIFVSFTFPLFFFQHTLIYVIRTCFICCLYATELLQKQSMYIL